MMLKTIEDIKAATLQEGGSIHWFSPETMRWHKSRVCNEVISDGDLGAYFVSSEKQGDEYARLYTVRYCTATGNISAVGEYQQYRTRMQALKAMYTAAAEGVRDV